MKSISEAAKNIDGQPMFKLLDKARKLEASGRDIIHLEIGDPDFPTPENIVNAACQSLKDGLTHYTSSFGLPAFSEVIREATAYSRQFKPDRDQILITPGANIAIFYAVFCLANPGDEVIIPDPGFPSYDSTIKMCGVKAVRVPLREENSFRMAAADLESRITDKTRLIIINSPHNPTGSVMSAADMRAIYRIAEKYDIYLCSDEIYARMIYDGSFSSPSLYDHCRERVIITNGFSKAFAMTGWRLGAIVGPVEVIERMGQLLQTTSSCVAPFIQVAGIEAIQGDQSVVLQMMAEYQKRRDLLVAGLNEVKHMHCLNPGGAFYLFPNIKKSGMSSQVFADLILEEANVALLPGSNFGQHGEGYLRLCYAASQERILEAIERIKRVVGVKT